MQSLTGMWMMFRVLQSMSTYSWCIPQNLKSSSNVIFFPRLELSLFHFVYEVLAQPRRRKFMEAAKFWPDLSWLAWNWLIQTEIYTDRVEQCQLIKTNKQEQISLAIILTNKFIIILVNSCQDEKQEKRWIYMSWWKSVREKKIKNITTGPLRKSFGRGS